MDLRIETGREHVIFSLGSFRVPSDYEGASTEFPLEIVPLKDESLDQTADSLRTCQMITSVEGTCAPEY